MAIDSRCKQSLMEVVASVRKDGYKRGFHDGLIKGNDEGFNRGIRKGILEMEKLYGQQWGG